MSLKHNGSDGNDLPRGILETALELWSQSDSEHIIPIVGKSMLPLFQEGDQVLVRGVGEAVRQGDILVFRQMGQLICHRLLTITQNEEGDLLFLTKGDNLLRPDPWIKQRDVLGVVFWVRRGDQLLSFDTRQWLVFNRFIAWMMVLQVSFDQRQTNHRPSPEVESPRNQYSIFAKVLHRANHFILRMMQGFHRIKGK